MGSAKIRNNADQIMERPGEGAVILMEKWLDRSGEDLLLKGSRCLHCGNTFFPPKVLCPSCGQSESIGEIRVGPKGKIHAFTVARISAPGFPTPYAFGWVDFPEGIRFFGRFDRCDGLEIGMDVALTLGKIRELENLTQYGPVFTAAEGRVK